MRGNDVNDFHAAHLDTACRAEASSEGGMKQVLSQIVALHGRI